jgi:hypothetical protein
MTKVAIFVEGFTEFYFMERLIQEMAGYGQVHLKLAKQHAGEFNFYNARGAPAESAQHEVLLVNCTGDGKVKPFILERKPFLIKNGYTFALGLQDLFPKVLTDREKFEEGLAKGLNDASIEIQICLAVKEIEAWFLNESAHYAKLNSALVPARITAELGFDPVSDNAENVVTHPAVLLDKIYNLSGLSYRKSQGESQRTVQALDYEEICVTVRHMSSSLDRLIRLLDTRIFGTSVISAIPSTVAA